jgi:hypothetical protein
MSKLIRALAVASILVSMTAALQGSGARYYRAVAHSGAAVYLLDEDGTAVYTHRVGRAPVISFDRRLTSASGNEPWRWSKPPMSFGPLGDRLLVVNGTTSAELFAAGGRHLRTIKLPIPATAAFSNGDEIWIYSALPSVSGRRFWRSRDGEHYAAVPYDLSVSSDLRARFLELQLTGSLAPDGTLYFAQLIGPPRALQLRADGTIVRQLAVAYSRTKRRNSLVAYRPGANEPTDYSSPVAEITFFGDVIVVLRNREDATVNAAVSEQTKRRADVYDTAGHHRGTATFTESVRTITGFSGGRITALVNGDRVVTAAVGKAEQGRIVE